MRLIAIFDLPTESKEDLRNYRKFVKYLTGEGYLRVQFSVYAKLCINNDSAKTAAKRLLENAPKDGDVRFLVITENQYLDIVDVNNSRSIQENITTIDRTMMIGGMNDENCSE